jgi:lysophospholipase L1-like esterase
MLKNSTIPYVDLSNMFADNENWIFMDEIHLNTQGNFEIAKFLAPKIRQLFK